MARPCNILVLSCLFFLVNKLVANQSMNCTEGAQVPFFSACITKKVEPIFSSEENVQMRKIVSPRPFCLLHHIAAAVTIGAAQRGAAVVGRWRRYEGGGGVLILWRMYVRLSMEPIHFPKELAFLRSWSAYKYVYDLFLKVSLIQNESMRSSFLPKCKPNITRISALPNK